MATNAISSSSNVAQQLLQPNPKSDEAKAAEATAKAKQAQEQQAQQAQQVQPTQQSRPVLNSQGQLTGGTINVIA